MFAFIALFSANSCEKERETAKAYPLTAVADRDGSSLPTVTHGMLHFSNFAQFNAFEQSLKTKEADAAQIKTAYSVLGVDTTAETLPNLTDNPVCLVTENAIGGYTSARKAEENVINAALNSGNDSIFSIVIFPHWKTALNQHMAVHIGNRIYQHFKDGGIAIILNDDWAKYEEIKTTPFEDLRQGYNLILTSDSRDAWDDYFTRKTDGRIDEAKPIFKPRFSETRNSVGDILIKNISWVETSLGANAYKWTYADGSFSYGIEPSRAVSQTESIKVQIDNGSGHTQTIEGSENILECGTDNFTITHVTANKITFELPSFSIASNYTIKWLFSNGAISTTNPVTKTFNAAGTVTCQLLFKNWDTSWADRLSSDEAFCD